MRLKPVHILLVEDNEGDILLTLDAFEESRVKADISVARDGKEALDFLFQRESFVDAEKADLILLDINIPIYNGHEVLQQIKSDAALRKIPVIMLTTSSNRKDVDKAYDNHSNSYVVKPLNMEDFLEAIRKIEAFWLQLSTLAD